MLKPMTDQEQIIRQMPSEMLVEALPDETEADARIKKVFTNQCTGCHTPGYPLQFKFDEAGWNKVINMMKMVLGNGSVPANAKANAIIEHNQKELAAYLARARGPGESSMKVATRARPSGEAARAVWTLYDHPLNPNAGIRACSPSTSSAKPLARSRTRRSRASAIQAITAARSSSCSRGPIRSAW